MSPLYPINLRQPTGVVLCLVLVFILLGLVVYDCRAEDKLFVDRAVSLRVLQQRASECVAQGNCPVEITNLCGLKRLHGFVIDTVGHDVILLGQVKLKAPSLRLDDMVVALRNIWGRYDSIVGNVQYHSPPGCSIDPEEDILRQLNEVVSRLDSSDEEMDEAIMRWHRICRQEQRVSVLGIPHNTRFAKVMVDADYFMKRLVDGSETAGLKDLRSLMDMYFDMAKEELVKHQRVPALSSLNRFWFTPGENTYRTSGDAIIISRCDVILMTEEEYLDEDGGRIGSGGAERTAQQFAQNLSERYSDLAMNKPLYAELEGLFRFVALARVMNELGALSRTDLDLSYLLDHYPIGTVEVERTVPGVSNAKRFEHEVKHADYVETFQLAMPTCGGVTIDIVVDAKALVGDKSGQLDDLTKAVLEERPNEDSLFYDIPPHVLEFLKNILSESNRPRPPKG